MAMQAVVAGSGIFVATPAHVAEVPYENAYGYAKMTYAPNAVLKKQMFCLNATTALTLSKAAQVVELS